MCNMGGSSWKFGRVSYALSRFNDLYSKLREGSECTVVDVSGEVDVSARNQRCSSVRPKYVGRV